MLKLFSPYQHCRTDFKGYIYIYIYTHTHIVFVGNLACNRKAVRELSVSQGTDYEGEAKLKAAQKKTKEDKLFVIKLKLNNIANQANIL